MKRTSTLSRQHGDLIEVVKTIAPLLSPEALSQDASEVRSLLSKLAGKLKIHLAMEDNSLYPELLQSSDPKVRAMAERFVSEMGGITEVFDAYLAKWAEKTLIQKDAAAFVRETEGLFVALGARIEREESELYPLLD